MTLYRTERRRTPDKSFDLIHLLDSIQRGAEQAFNSVYLLDLIQNGAALETHDTVTILIGPLEPRFGVQTSSRLTCCSGSSSLRLLLADLADARVPQDSTCPTTTATPKAPAPKKGYVALPLRATRSSRLHAGSSALALACSSAWWHATIAAAAGTARPSKLEHSWKEQRRHWWCTVCTVILQDDAEQSRALLEKHEKHAEEPRQLRT